MHCPFCGFEDSKVIDSRLVAAGNQVRRRRECLKCEERFTTYEIAELILPAIIKRDGRRKPFDEGKMRTGIMRALEKRPVSTEAVENMIVDLKQRLRSTGEREISSKILGEWVVEALRQLDEVAYVRFASVYRRFQDLQAFREEISRMEQKEPTVE